MDDIYTLKSDVGGYVLAKFEGFENGALGDCVEVYDIWRTKTRMRCYCPARGPCKHPDIVTMFLRDGKLNTRWYLNWTMHQWVKIPDPNEWFEKLWADSDAP